MFQQTEEKSYLSLFSKKYFFKLSLNSFIRFKCDVFCKITVNLRLRVIVNVFFFMLSVLNKVLGLLFGSEYRVRI